MFRNVRLIAVPILGWSLASCSGGTADEYGTVPTIGTPVVLFNVSGGESTH